MAEAARWMHGDLIQGDPASRWTGGALDSRQVRGGELFFALVGESTDGHRFVASALAAGATAAVVHEAVDAPANGTLLAVEDTYRALHDLTRELRRHVPERLVGLTGSTGKTTTKEILTALLSRRFRTAGSPGNLNNLYGFPLALMGIPDDTEWMVAEMGMSTPGELAAVSRLGRPDVALLLNVRPVHLERLGSLDAVAEAKAEILAGLAPDGVVVANADDSRVRDIARRHAGRVVWFGRESAEAAYRVEGVAPRPEGLGTRFRLVTPEGEAPVELPMHGAYNVENFLAAAACAHELGIPLDEIVATAPTLEPIGGRGRILRLPGGVILVDDSYNSNPLALAGALESARALPGARHLAVLGDMLELGPEAERYHREAGRAAAAAGFSLVVGVGELSRGLVDAVRDAGVPAHWIADADAAAAWVPRRVAAGDVLLVKGSRGIGLERVVEALRRAPEGEA
jgi:UDP-N-acetylmuramoyl-tripeptide--D-alanyl-D-alanine ligase